MKLRRLSALVLAMIMVLAIGITSSVAEETVILLQNINSSIIHKEVI